MKGTISKDHIPASKYQLLFVGMPPLTITEISGIENELDVAELPDRTVASGGRTKPSEFTFRIPAHETVQLAALELWYSMCKGDVDPAYQLSGTLIMQSISGNLLRTYSVIDAFPSKRVLPELSLESEGEMTTIEWTMRCQDVFFVS